MSFNNSFGKVCLRVIHNDWHVDIDFICTKDGEDKASSADEPNTTASGVTEVTSGLYDQVHSSDKLSLVGKPSDNDDLYSQTNKDAERNDKDLEDSDKPAAPDGGWGWWCVVGCALAHFFIGTVGSVL